RRPCRVAGEAFVPREVLSVVAGRLGRERRELRHRVRPARELADERDETARVRRGAEEEVAEPAALRRDPGGDRPRRAVTRLATDLDFVVALGVDLAVAVDFALGV